MKEKNFFSLAGLLIVIAAFVVGCSTFAPMQTTAQYPADGAKYVILGRVTLVALKEKTAYTKLLEKAKTIYPNADDGVNIIVDVKVTKFFWLKKYKYVLSGIAIDYVEVR